MNLLLHGVAAIRNPWNCGTQVQHESARTAAAQVYKLVKTAKIYGCAVCTDLRPATAAIFFGYAAQCMIISAQIRMSLLCYKTAKFYQCGSVQTRT